MKAALLYGIKDIRIENIEKPKIGPNDVSIDVIVSNLSVSELNSYKGIRQRKSFPHVPGHEFSGRINEIGNKIKDLNVGDRVVPLSHVPCHKCYFCVRGKTDLCMNPLESKPGGSFTEHVVIHGNGVFKLPSKITLEEAAFVEPLSTCISAISKSNIKISNSVAILGQGPMGLMLLQLCKLSGAEPIFTTDMIDNRLNLSKELGSNYVINVKNENVVEKIIDETDNLGVDIVFESSGSTIAFEQAIKIVKKGGTIIQVGHIYKPVNLDALSLYYKDLKLISARGEPYHLAIDILNSGKVDVNRLITHTFTLDDILKAYEILDNKEKTDAIIVQLKGFL